ncbi:hypothetical protein Q8A67_018027 [Cirrhinus molitorella]|uniref:Uncharacterized protein n=1 Tax=Cirrhinus molitorella TaxID=172907 RepID=A0AA88PF56_9TELE|nr:hypothetical protein Q8A67_018027 [Cirrhinus molitorella]
MVLDTQHINPAQTEWRWYITAHECRTLSKLTLNYKEKEIAERRENDRIEGQRRAASAALDGVRKRGLTGGPGRIDRPGSSCQRKSSSGTSQVKPHVKQSDRKEGAKREMRETKLKLYSCQGAKKCVLNSSPGQVHRDTAS